MLNKIDHLGIAVSDLDAAIDRWTKTLGMKLAHREVIEEQGVEVAKFGVGESAVELICPLGPDTPVGKFLTKRGEGIHHVAFAVTDIDASLAKLEAEGARLIDKKPRIGAGGDLIAFIHPATTGGVLTELKQGNKN